MMIADTSIWIEFLRQHQPIAGQLESFLEAQDILASEVVFGELLQGARDEAERELLRTYWNALPKCDETGIWIEAGQRSSNERFITKGVGLIDVSLLILAERMNAKLWTLDQRLKQITPPALLYL
jgi:predicted nucleic acid-binding protein